MSVDDYNAEHDATEEEITEAVDYAVDVALHYLKSERGGAMERKIEYTVLRIASNGDIPADVDQIPTEGDCPEWACEYIITGSGILAELAAYGEAFHAGWCNDGSSSVLFTLMEPIIEAKGGES